MNDSTTTQDVHCSTKSIMYNKKDLADAALKHDIETIVYVADEMFRPYILLKDIDDNPYWRPYDGQPIEMVRKYHAWELEAQKQFKEKSRSQEEIDELRNVLLAVQVVYGFFELEEQKDDTFIGDVLTVVSTKTALMWYCKDLNKKYEDVRKGVDDPGEKSTLNAYFSLSWYYISNFFNVLRTVSENAAAAGGTNEKQV